MDRLLYREKYSFLSFCIFVALLQPTRALADDAPTVEFDSSFLMTSESSSIDLSRFSKGGMAIPGTYRTRIFLNNEMIEMQEVTFVEQADKTVIPCLTPRLLAQMPLNTDKLPESALAADADSCVDLKALIPEATIQFDSSEQQLNLLVPQIYVNRQARGTVPPSLWDSGVPAALLGYNMNAYQSDSYGRSYKSMYSGINGGVNLGAWYFRHNGSWNWNENTGGHYQTINSYVQRDIPFIKGRVMLGQANSSGQIFDTLPFTGVKLQSDERMEPRSRRGYAPEIRGIARTNAQVIVRQNGTLLYETTVSPGEFIIDDLYPTGYGGDLEVTVREADGSEQHFQVPFSSVAQLLRPGTSRYEFIAGELHSSYLRNDPSLMQGSWQYGLNNWMTAYGGLQGGDHYTAGQGGMAVATPVGAVSLDITHARADLGKSGGSDVSTRGESYRLSYSKNITETQSNFSLAAYRFSTSGYMDFLTAAQTRDAMQDGFNSNHIRRTKNRFTLTASQGLTDGWGQVYVSSSLQNYWNADGTDKQYQVGYSNYLNRITWGVSGNRSYNVAGRSRDSIVVNMSFPLGSTYRAPTGRLSYTNTDDGRNSWQAGMSGTAGNESQFSYSLSGTSANQGGGSSGSASGQYRSSFTSLSSSVSSGRHYTSASAGLSGTLIGHGGGITASPYQGETFALVEAKGAEGAKVSGYSGVFVDGNGYALVPYLDAYQMNNVVVDLQGTEAGVELDNTSQNIAPRERAVVKLTYQSRSGRPILITSRYANTPLPFGAEVKEASGNVVGYVGQGGQIYARVEQDSGQLAVDWGTGADQQCFIRYQLSAVDKKSRSTSLDEINADCLKDGEHKG